MLLNELVDFVDSAKSGEDYWIIQNRLATEIEAHELRIQRTRRRHHRLRDLIKRGSQNSGRSSPDNADQLRRLQELMRKNDVMEEGHRFARGVELYLGDVLAYKMMPDHVVSLHGRNSSPGFFGGKSGRTLELEIGAFLTSHGWKVLLHDATHCLKIGDLTAFHQEKGIISIELGAGNSGRKQRQSERMHLLNSVLKEDMSGINSDDLVNHSLPTHLIEGESHDEYNLAAFIAVADCLETGCKVIQPEEGVLYAACARGQGAEALIRELNPKERPWRNYLLATFSDRIVWKFSWVPPIMSLSLPWEPIVSLLRGDFYFWVFLDVDHIKRRLGALAPMLTVSDESDCLQMFIASENGLSVVGPRPIENVQYGLATLESALQTVAARARVDLSEFAAGLEIKGSQ